MIVVFFILQSKIIDSRHRAGWLSMKWGIAALPFTTTSDEPMSLICPKICGFLA